MLDALTVNGPYSPEQEERIREAVEELCDRIGVQMAAGKLCTTEPALTDLLAGRRPPKAMLVTLLAKQNGETVEQLLDPKRPKKAAEPAPAEAKPATPTAAGPPLAAPPPAAPPAAPPPAPFAAIAMPVAIVAPATFAASVAAPPTFAPAVAAVAPAPLSTPPPAVPAPAPSMNAAAAIERPSSDLEGTSSAEPRLTLIEYASFSMGLELLPHRETDVHAHFGLGDSTVRQREIDHWTAFLQTNPRERREWPQMRERMRNYWLRFDGQVVAPPVAAPAAEPPKKPVPPAGPPISLEAYAALCVELHRAPANAESTFAFYGLTEAHARDQVSRYWTDRLAQFPSERVEWERLYRERQHALDARSSQPMAAPLPKQYVAAVKPMNADPVPTMSLAAYALLCVELEKKPKEREQVYKRHGLADPQKRRLAEESWRARLERDPAELAKWRQLTDEIRADWMDF